MRRAPVAVLLAAAACLAAAEARGELGVGSTRDDVIAALGQPRAVLSAGAREILTYAGGRVILENGVVARLDGVALPPAEPAARPTPLPATPAAPPASAAPAARAEDPWRTDFAQAQAEAAASKRRILALFTGSDWCPACREFEASVAHDPDFLATTHAAFVLLRLDYPRSIPQPAAVRAANEELRRRYRVHAYPSLRIISPDGGDWLAVNTSTPRTADGIADFYVQAVDEARRQKGGDRHWWWPF
jgi:protein disulfide-isomerase